MNPQLYEISFDGRILARGFWLYVWEITKPDGTMVYYVGRTGDKPSGFCQSSFDRFSKHLGSNTNNNALQRHLKRWRLNPESCRFRFRAVGPLLADREVDHGKKCDLASALEKALADSMTNAGYDVLNKVHCRMVLDADLWKSCRAVFAKAFPKLANAQ